MTAADYVEIAGYLLGLFAIGFVAGYTVTMFKRLSEHV